MYHEQKLADELARDRHTEVPAFFVAVALFVVVFVVGLIGPKLRFWPTQRTDGELTGIAKLFEASCS